MAEAKQKKYRVLAGLDYPPDRRAEPGDVVDDLVPSSIGWLVKGGYIKEVAANTPVTGSTSNKTIAIAAGIASVVNATPDEPTGKDKK